MFSKSFDLKRSDVFIVILLLLIVDLVFCSNIELSLRYTDGFFRVISGYIYSDQRNRLHSPFYQMETEAQDGFRPSLNSAKCPAKTNSLSSRDP